MVCEVDKGSADGDGGVQNDIAGRKSRPRSADGGLKSTNAGEQPIQGKQRRTVREVKFRA